MDQYIKKKGYVLLTTIYVMIVFALFAVTVAAFISGESISHAMLLNGFKALHLADAGAEYLIGKALASDMDWSNNTNSYSNVSFGGGVFDSAIVSSTRDSCTIESSGYINKNGGFLQLKRTVIVKLQKTISDNMLLNAISAVGSINMSGDNNFTVNGGDIVSGQSINFNGANNYSGDFSLASNESISLPNIDWDQYKAIAQSQGNYYAGDLDFGASTTASGVYYVEGNVTLRNNVTINGTIICKSSILMDDARNFTITPDPGYPALVVDGGLTGSISGEDWRNATINGLIYSSGSINLTDMRNVTVNGGIISGGSLTLPSANNYTINYNPTIQDVPFLLDHPLISITSWVNL